MKRLTCAYRSHVLMVFALIACTVTNAFVMPDGLAEIVTWTLTIVKKIHALTMALVLIWLMVTSATAYQDTKPKIVSTQPTTARVNHAKTVLHVSMNWTVINANVVPDSLVCNAKVCNNLMMVFSLQSTIKKN